jgi:CheY-like chemotaxis protein
MEAVGRLAGGVAHDFNNVLMAVLGRCDLLKFRLPAGSPLREDVEEIRIAADRAAILTRQLLAFSRRQLLQPRLMNLNLVLGGVERLVRRLLGEEVELLTALAPDLNSVRVDPGQIEQVIMALALNAREAMPSGGTLRLETANVALSDPELLEIADIPPGPYVLLTIQDSGVGMDGEVLAHIFEPFFTTKGPGQGTGMGLATAYGIVRQSGGGIMVESAPGCGATFRIYFPRAIDTPETPPPASGAGAPAASATILVAEDDPGVRSVVTQVLETYGYRVLTANGGPEALRLSAGHPGPIHLLLTDVVMPGMSGPALAKTLTPTRPEMQVLYMSGYTEDHFAQQGILIPDVPFLPKPFSADGLVQRVQEMLAKPVAGQGT